MCIRDSLNPGASCRGLRHLGPQLAGLLRRNHIRKLRHIRVLAPGFRKPHAPGNILDFSNSAIITDKFHLHARMLFQNNALGKPGLRRLPVRTHQSAGPQKRSAEIPGHHHAGIAAVSYTHLDVYKRQHVFYVSLIFLGLYTLMLYLQKTKRLLSSTAFVLKMCIRDSI